MATRRDELSAHTFARKRTLAAFLQPESRVSDEEAPRPVRAMVPSVVMGVALVAGCIAWGAIAPSAPKGWDTPGEHIIVDTKSTTRYVVLDSNGKEEGGEQLHPILNFASGKLVLDKGKGEVIEVDGENIDESSIARGATIGIPYAPDRLPEPKDAETAKEWAVCEKPGANGSGNQQQALFVLGGKDKQALQGKNRLGDNEALHVQDSSTGVQYLVDGKGTKLQVGPNNYDDRDRRLLVDVALKNAGEPQPVSTEWLNTLREGTALQFPEQLPGFGESPSFSGASELPEEARQVGLVLKSTGADPYYYVVGKEGIQRVTPLLADLYMGRGELQQKPVSVSSYSVVAAGARTDTLKGGDSWPKEILKQVNTPAEGIDGTSRMASCSVYTGKVGPDGQPELAAWAGADYPRKTVEGSANAYVTSGSGLLFREVSGNGKGGGSQYLLTDSGLRYAVSGSSGGKQEDSAKARLGYEKTKSALVPQAWASLLPKGPSLDTESASQEQGM